MAIIFCFEKEEDQQFSILMLLCKLILTTNTQKLKVFSF